jgi:hypothetical protein
MSTARHTAHLCPTCGQPVVPGDLVLLPVKALVLDIVRRHPGVSAEELRGLVWANDPNGGPKNRKTIHVHILQLNCLLAQHGIAVRGSRTSGYRVVRI